MLLPLVGRHCVQWLLLRKFIFNEHNIKDLS